MTPVHLHLMLNHLPLFASAMACLILVFAIFKQIEDFKKLAYVILVAAGMATPAVFFSGQRAEEKVEDISGVSKDALEAHEEAGEGAMAAMAGLGALALAQLCLYLFPNSARLRNKTSIAVLLAASLAFAWVAWTANLGGKIRHSEELGAPSSGSGETGTGD